MSLRLTLGLILIWWSADNCNPNVCAVQSGAGTHFSLHSDDHRIFAPVCQDNVVASHLSAAQSYIGQVWRGLVVHFFALEL